MTTPEEAHNRADILLEISAERNRQDVLHAGDTIADHDGPDVDARSLLSAMAIQLGSRSRSINDRVERELPPGLRPTPLSILGEEIGEVGRALFDSEGDAALRAELIQVAACALAWIESIDARGDD